MNQMIRVGVNLPYSDRPLPVKAWRQIDAMHPEQFVITSDVRPGTPKHDTVHNRSTYPELLGDPSIAGHTSGVEQSDCDHLIGGESRPSVSFPPLKPRFDPGVVPVASRHSFRMSSRSVAVASGRATFLNTVCHVRFHGAKPEMATALIGNTVNNMGADIVIPDAEQVVPVRTIMTDDLIIGRPMLRCKPPRSMTCVHASDTAAWADLITVRPLTASPAGAVTCGLVNLSPKPHHERRASKLTLGHRSISFGVLPRTVVAVPGLSNRRIIPCY
jgi:hypothetical protein